MRSQIRHHRRAVLPAALLIGIALLVARLGAGTAAAQHAAAGPTRGGTLRVALSGDMVTFDPAQAASDDWLVLQGTLFNGLYGIDRMGKPQVDLAAASPTVS